MDSHQKMIDDHYDGDVKHFDNAYAEAIIEGRQDMVQWDDLLASATTLPDLQDQGRELIEHHLGYLPGDNVILPYEPYIRGLIHGYHQSQMPEDEYNRQVIDHVKLIRNADMLLNLCSNYDPEIYTNYSKTYSLYGYAVRNRLASFLGYEPKLEHSLVAEMWMRDVMAKDTFKLSAHISVVDYKAITLIKYREILLDQGKVAADESPLVGIF